MSREMFAGKLIRLVGIVLALCLVITFLVTTQVDRDNRAHINNKLSQVGMRLSDAVVSRIQLYQYGLRGARGVVVTAGDRLSRELFIRYSASRDTDREFPGARGFGVIKRVPADKETEFLDSARRDGYPDFHLRQLTPHDGERFIIQYIEPVSRNLQAVGLDIASESNRRNAAVDAIRSGEVRLTGPITLVQATGNPLQSFLILMPVYRGVVTPPTEAERDALGYGWSYAPLVMQEVLSDLTLDEDGVHLVLRDVTDSDSGTQVFESRSPVADAEAGIAFSNVRKVYGRVWQFEYFATPAFIASLNLLQPELVAVIGLSVSLLICAALWLYIDSRRSRLQTQHHKNLKAAMVESSPDAIMTSDMNGTITSWNSAAERLFGFAQAEAVGHDLNALIIPPELAEEELLIRDKIANDTKVPHFITRRRRKDGSVFDVSIAVAPISESGIVTGYSKTIRDITHEVAARRQIVEMNHNLEQQVVRRTQELADSRRTLQGILDNVPNSIAYWDRDVRLLMANRTCLESWGVTLEQAIGRSLKELAEDELYRKIWPTFERVLTTSKAQTDELTFQTADRERPTVVLTVVPEIREGSVNGLYANVYEVTELRMNQEQLEIAVRENQALLSTINEQMLYSVTDTRGRIIDANENFCRVSGYSRDELIGNKHSILNSGRHPETFWKDMWKTISSGHSWRGDICNLSKDGEIGWFDSVIAPFAGVDGKIERYVALRTDITEKRLAESERNRVNLLLSSVLDAASEVAVIAGDPEGVITIFNTGAEVMLGYRAEEMVGRQTPAIIHREDEVVARGRELSEQFGEEIAGFEVFVYLARLKGSEIRQWTYVRKDGSELQVSLAVTAMRDDSGEVTGYLGVAVDITKEEISRREMMSARDQLAIAADVAELGIWTWDVVENVLQWNERMFELYEQPKSLGDEGLRYSHWRDRIHPEDLPEAEAKLNAALEGKGVFDPEFRIITPQGTVRWIQATAQVETDAHGKVIKITGVNRDITAQLNLERELRRAKELADSSNAAKSAFLANMSHEIRTPMNAVLGMLRLVSNTDLDQRQRLYLQKADIAARSLLELLNDLLDFSKIEAGKLSLEKEIVEVNPMIEELAVVLSGYRTNKAIDLVFDIDPTLPRRVVMDSLRLRQVLINLGGNALKFTESGLVVVRIARSRSDGDTATLLFEVTDTGIGISQQQQDRIFEDFIQAEGSISRRFGGTGLGLVICKRLIELMGGEIQLQSELGAGSRFWFELTVDVEDEMPLAKVAAPAELLLVDHKADVAEIYRGILEGIGYRVSVAESAASAIGLATAARKRGQAFGVVLINWGLPDISANQVAEFIVSDTETPPGVILLADIGEDLEELYSNQQYYDLLMHKPVTPRQLEEAITQLLQGSREADEPTQPSESSRPLQGVKLLIVEDNDMNREIAAELLQEEGAQVELASGGLEGVEKVLDHGEKIDVVIMDMQMPDIDGLEATRRIRADQRYISLPIMAMTANASPSDRALCLAAGMNEHIGKPIDMNLVVPTILSLLSGDVETAVAVDSAASPDLRQEVMKRFGDNTGLFLKVVPRFEPTMAQSMDDIERGLSHRDQKTVRAALHSIKGTSGTMGARSLAELAEKLENGVKRADNSSWLEIVEPETIENLREMIRRSVNELNSLAEELSPDSTPGDRDRPVSERELRDQLREIVPLLESDNMRALELMAAIQNSVSLECHRKLKPLQEQIDELDFRGAVKTINQIIGGL